MAGKPVAIVTGSSTGIGYQTALALARKGYVVVVATRNRERGEAAASSINAALRGEGTPLLERGEAVFLPLDTARLGSVREFAEEYQRRYDRLDALVNNAGMNSTGFTPEQRVSADGLAITFQSNFLGHFFLTNLLLPLLKATALVPGSSGGPPVRVVNLSSVTHRLVKKRPDWGRAIAKDAGSGYALSKLAATLHAFELQRRFASEGIADKLQAIAVNPGGVASDIWRTMPSSCMCWFRTFQSLFFLNTAQGAATSVAAATQRDFAGKPLGAGELLYLTPYRIPASWGGEWGRLLADSLGPFAGARPGLSTPMSRDPVLAAQLWAASDAAVAKVVATQA